MREYGKTKSSRILVLVRESVREPDFGVAAVTPAKKFRERS